MNGAVCSKCSQPLKGNYYVTLTHEPICERCVLESMKVEEDPTPGLGYAAFDGEI